MSMIELRAVSKIYRGRPVIDTLSLYVDAGERIVLFGPSGCGKSTILSMIAGLVQPDSGDVLIDGQIVASNGKSLCEPQRRGIGMVFQDLALWPHMTVAENIGFGLMAKRVPLKQREGQIREIAEIVGMGDYLNVRPGELSGGEQQRVALARALVLAPRIVLMDEPLSALDRSLNERLRSEILRLHERLRFALLYVTHSSPEAKDLGNRIVYMSHGRIISQQAASEVADSDRVFLPAEEHP